MSEPPPSKNIVISRTSFNDLPDETTTDIFLRLSVKDLIRSTSNKTWAVLKDCGFPLDITKNGTLLIEAFRSNYLDVTSIVSFNVKSMVYKDHGFGKARGREVSGSIPGPLTLDTSFPESLIMYEGGKSLLKDEK
ncbi:hypothetical protein AgCh_001744 [Apium graveolens]